MDTLVFILQYKHIIQIIKLLIHSEKKKIPTASECISFTKQIEILRANGLLFTS